AGTLATFGVPHEVGTVIGVQGTSLPAQVRVVDTTVETALVEAQRIGNAQVGPLAGFRIQRNQRIRVRTGQDRRVLAEADDVVLIHPAEVVEVGRVVGITHLRTRGLPDVPAFGAVRTLVSAGAVQHGATAAVEAHPL